VHEGDTGFGAQIELAGSVGFVGELVSDRCVDDAPTKPIPIDAERVQRLLRQINSSAIEILGDVAQKVGELECDPQIDRGAFEFFGIDGWVGATENGQHL
jgi:hypothetical protein